jgi:hypothetical protein
VAPLIVLGGSIASNFANGGIAWERLSWALGLRRLGLDVLIVDQLDRARCVHAGPGPRSYETCLNYGYFRQVVEAFGLADAAALVGDQGESLFGPSFPELLDRVAAAAMLVNVAGNVRLDEIKRCARLRILVDVDPGLTQARLASTETSPRILGHDLYFTIGENVGTAASSIPTGGIRWLHTRQPVLLDAWPQAPTASPLRFTTVATLRGVGPHGPVSGFRDKADELLGVIDVPDATSAVMELAVKFRASEAAERARLRRRGWRVVDAGAVAAGPDAFRRYVQSSGAEFSVAKGAYTETRSGWFSDRTTRYLASGKPAVVQDTGFTRSIPVGDGLIAYRNRAEAIDGIERVTAEYDHHSAAARELAERFFDSDAVLRRFVDDVEASRPGALR